MKEQVKMILTDLDETLLTDDKDITQRTRQVFQQCKERGILTGFATARAELPSRKYMEILQPDIKILDNGALVMIGDKIIEQVMISAEDVDSILRQMLQIEGIGDITVETEHIFYSNCPCAGETYGSDYAHGIYNDYREPLQLPSYKMTIETANEQAFIDVMNQYPRCKGFGFAMQDWYCICSKGVSKGEGAKKAASYLKIPPAQIAAFGDDISDIEMLQYCGYGVAMINALPRVKEAGNYLTEEDYNHDGVANFIEKHFF